MQKGLNWVKEDEWVGINVKNKQKGVKKSMWMKIRRSDWCRICVLNMEMVLKGGRRDVDRSIEVKEGRKKDEEEEEEEERRWELIRRKRERRCSRKKRSKTNRWKE
jgi:hypothetical protein